MISFNASEREGCFVMNGVSFFVAEGLFFLGMSLGILGSTDSDRTRQGAWVLLTIGGLSLLAGFVIAAYQNRQKPKNTRNGRRILKSISLSESFDSLLHSAQSLPLLKGRNFSSELRTVLHPLKVTVPAHHSVIVQHFSGRDLSIVSESETSLLRSGELVRVLEDSGDTSLSIEAAHDALSDSERAPQVLLHFVDEH